MSHAIAASPHACVSAALRAARSVVAKWIGRPNAAKRLAGLANVSARTPERWLTGTIDPDLEACLTLIANDPDARAAYAAELATIFRALDAAETARRAKHEADGEAVLLDRQRDV